uniref:Uncharacterized protein n=1 Tax=Amphimedon queenslandica TaxID=400682 RepID=A0A1X7TVA4_AMPQE
MSSPELVVFQKSSSDIADAASGLLSSFPVKLYSKDIIDSKLRDNVTGMTGLGPDQKANLLLKGIEDKLKHAKSEKERKELFELILNVMDDNIPLDSVAEKMREEYQKEVAKPKKEKEKSSREVNDGPGVTDSGQAQVDRPAMMKALNAVGQQLSRVQHSRYHLAVLILMEGDKVATQGEFLQLFQTAQKKLGSCQDAIAFTIAVLERSHFGNTEDLKPFASSGYVLDDSVELFLAINDFYNQMNDKNFSSAKVVVSGSFFNSRDLSELDRSGLVSLLFSEGVVAIVDDAVSKIEGFLDSKSYKGFEERCKRSAAERSDTKPPTTGASNTLPSTNKVPIGSHVNGGGTNGTTNAPVPKRRVETDSPAVDEATKLPDHKQHGVIEFECDDKFKEIAYKMNKLSRGYCIIINMKKDREEGNQEDINSLRTLFEDTLQFTFKV